MNKFVSRAGEKLQYVLTSFNISVKGLTCADFGSSTGGFVDCLLQNSASKVYSVDVSYGELNWNLRNDPRIVVMERSNAMHVKLPEKMDFTSIDTGWTKQALVLPNALANLKSDGQIISLIKPHYEADKKYIHKGKLDEDKIDEVLEQIKQDIVNSGGELKGIVESPILGKRKENKEFLAWISKR